MPVYSPQPQTCSLCGSDTWGAGFALHGRLLCAACYQQAEALATRPANVAPVTGTPVFNGPASLPRRTP